MFWQLALRRPPNFMPLIGRVCDLCLYVSVCFCVYSSQCSTDVKSLKVIRETNRSCISYGPLFSIPKHYRIENSIWKYEISRWTNPKNDITTEQKWHI